MDIDKTRPINEEEHKLHVEQTYIEFKDLIRFDDEPVKDWETFGRLMFHDDDCIPEGITRDEWEDILWDVWVRYRDED